MILLQIVIVSSWDSSCGKIMSPSPELLSPSSKNNESLFLTRGYAQAYDELLQGQGCANESLAHS